MKLSNFVSSLSDCQILVAPCQCGCQWVALAGERVTRFEATFALWELPNIPFYLQSRPIFAFSLVFTKTLFIRDLSLVPPQRI